MVQQQNRLIGSTPEIANTNRHHTERRDIQEAEVDHIEEFRVVLHALWRAYRLGVSAAQAVGDGTHPDELGGAVDGAGDPYTHYHELQQ